MSGTRPNHRQFTFKVGTNRPSTGVARSEGEWRSPVWVRRLPSLRSSRSAARAITPLSARRHCLREARRRGGARAIAGAGGEAPWGSWALAVLGLAPSRGADGETWEKGACSPCGRTISSARLLLDTDCGMVAGAGSRWWCARGWLCIRPIRRTARRGEAGTALPWRCLVAALGFTGRARGRRRGRRPPAAEVLHLSPPPHGSARSCRWRCCRRREGRRQPSALAVARARAAVLRSRAPSVGTVLDRPASSPTLRSAGPPGPRVSNDDGRLLW